MTTNEESDLSIFSFNKFKAKILPQLKPGQPLAGVDRASHRKEGSFE